MAYRFMEDRISLENKILRRFLMKRVLTIMVSMMVLFTFVSAMADEGSSGTAGYEKELKMMSTLYQLAPEQFDDEKTMYTYIDFMALINAQTIDMYNLACVTRDSDGGKLLEGVMEMAKSSADVSNIAATGYLSWQNGEMTLDEYLKVLMPMVDSVLGSKKQ